MRNSIAVFLMVVFLASISEGAWAPNAMPKTQAALKVPAALKDAITDPIGDTFGAGAVQPDITSFSASFTGSALVISITLSNAIDPTNFVGLVDLDTDQNPATGATPTVDLYSPYTSQLGDEYLLSFDAANAQASLSRTSDATMTAVPSSVSGGTITFTVPASDIGSPRAVNLATVVGTQPEPTDAAPNGGFITASAQPQAVPTMNEWGMIIFMLAAGLGSAYYLRRRKRT
ncbi:MAG: IPTL-CTERM sorting domain-containing protein [Nitrospiraceae bacterium]|nr:IPTL-CTERM sorting domain-containing protein [Nitrospiraceae bacterium]